MSLYTRLIFAPIILLLAMAAAAPAQPVPSSTPGKFVLGNIETFRSQILSEDRTVNIYLPAGYDGSVAEKYPVIYLLDGSADEDFIHIAGLVQFNNFPWINRVPRSIVVGIANVDRRRDFTFPTSVQADKVKLPTTGGSEKFIAFIEKELQPFIGSKYRTSGQNMLIGQSLGGLLAAEILFKKPQLFDKYVIISPSLWWNNGSLLESNPKILDESYSKMTGIYIGVGKEGLTPGQMPRVMEVDANLLADKLKAAGKKNLAVYFDYLPDEDHATVTHQAVFNAFRILYPAAAAEK